MTLFSEQFERLYGDKIKPSGIDERTLLASISGIDSSKWELSLHGCNMDDELKAELAQLSRNSADGNIFFDPAFLSASQERLGSPQKSLLILSEILGGERTIKLAMPLQHEMTGFPRRPVWRVWSHPFGPLSTPLVVRDDLSETVSKFAQMILSLKDGQTDALLFQDLPTQSAFAKELRKISFLRERMVEHGQGERAALLPGSPENYVTKAFNPKRLRELRRQFRKMSELGELELETTTKFWESMVRFEEFLLLETKSWKGRRGTSIHIIKKTAAFARQAVANLITHKNCRIYSLRLNGKAVSSLIVFRSGNKYFPWKMAFDEQYHQYSVGKQLAVLVSIELLKDKEFEGADSLAAPDNYMMNSIWFDRIKLSDLTISLEEDATKASMQVRQIAEAVDRKARLKRALKPVFMKLTSKP